MQTPLYNLLISPLPKEVRTAVISPLVDTLLEAGLSVPGVTAEDVDAREFAEVWCRRTGLRQGPTMNEQLYVIDKPPLRGPAPGAARLVTEADVPLAASWLRSFNLELVPTRAAVDDEQVIRQRPARAGYCSGRTTASR